VGPDGTDGLHKAREQALGTGEHVYGLDGQHRVNADHRISSLIQARICWRRWRSGNDGRRALRFE
jgi:hypothetical protein